MTLEEAIKHAERTYKENRSGWQYALKRGENKYAERCKKSMDEFGQLAEWLIELAERRKQPEIIRCRECKFSCKYEDSDIANYAGYANEVYCSEHDIYKHADWYCADGERRTDDRQGVN